MRSITTVSAALFALLVVACATGTSVSGQNDAKAYQANDYHAAAIDPTEPAKIDKIWGFLADEMAKEYQKGQPLLRLAHAKSHGCIRSTVFIYPNLPPYAAQGIFNISNQNRSFDAFMRFSNGVGRAFAPPPINVNSTDAFPDTRGIALKLFGVKGQKILPGYENAETQDFTFITTRSQFINTIDTGVGFFGAVHDGFASLTGWLALHPKTAYKFSLLSINGAHVHNMLNHFYWSQTARQHGTTAAKYKLSPCPTNSDTDFKLPADDEKLFDSDFITTNLQNSLKSRQCMILSAQFYQNEQTTPIEDATVDWPTPFVDLALISIRPQWVWNPKQIQYCDWLSFNPWHSIPEHTPLGVVERIRKVTYTKGAAQRHQYKNQGNTEPTHADWEAYGNL